MNSNRLKKVFYTITFAAISTTFNAATHAALVFQPPGLNPGDQYRLVFTTSIGRTAMSSAIGDYDGFVQSVADGSGLAALGETWLALAATPGVNAHDHTMSNPVTNGVGVPIYLVNGQKVADNYADLWDGTLDSPINATELGTASSPTLVWTGFSVHGNGYPSRQLGNSSNVIFVGSSQAANGSWALNQPGQAVGTWNETRPLYAMSGIITTAVPEPSAFLHFGLLGIALAMIRFARARSLQRPNCAVGDGLFDTR